MVLKALYPAVLAEMSRVLRPGGLAVLLTSQELRFEKQGSFEENRAVVQAALSTASLGQAWSLEHRRSFRLFVKTDACIYLLRRTEAAAAASSQAVPSTEAALAELRGSGARAPLSFRFEGSWGAFPWEDGSPWHEQWARDRPALVAFGQKDGQRRSQGEKAANVGRGQRG
ncbi:hypothetical protein AK812_SmicGene32692 [Symbiodinium microadriaticum]|uniref:Uncharacterized protein n=1 Tax=Symbiodinium microadriaticum TaxID=2951 RepID=A0A1Q9CTJ6_SYMMI|nr:hypothetical protein AK812_SmicGene32692 [Symbiodinium microadriaticum]